LVLQPLRLAQGSFLFQNFAPQLIHDLTLGSGGGARFRHLNVLKAKFFKIGFLVCAYKTSKKLAWSIG
jgi:hypothetical protein